MVSQKLIEINGKMYPIDTETNEEDNIEGPTRKEKIISAIREKYSIDDEIAILRQKDSKKEEFSEYNNFVENIKKNV